MPVRDTVKLGAALTPLWFLAQWPYNRSLLLTSVGSSTVLSACTCLFTLAFAAALGREPRGAAAKKLPEAAPRWWPSPTRAAAAAAAA
eukprot:CAMPEP_0206392682 /NCGR_PEP_ID=MMETSP0294-20121207/20140_1 /ASSEMBLY_ACC=CAM_ASM_000327 /TAXON_ID=39354 /ORGANISM="Heterosigma akashiwo, Strain CCMP2393" /LENGTH=87 /DNA_ID=CAMNT_0053845879 /DNA_START=306 /DNA_END=566 /DNA_ORIENTATION=-